MCLVTFFINLLLRGEVPRWWRNRMGRPLSPPQIHQKIIWMLSNFHKTTSECWWRTPRTQKGSLFSLKGGRTPSLLGRESWRKRSFQTVGNPLTSRSVGSSGILEGNITGRKRKKKQPTEHTPSHNSQRRSSLDACISHQRMGAGQEGAGCMLRVRTGPECPEDSLRALTWDSNPNCGSAREKTETVF